MNIMVFDVPAEKGGALSVLNDFYDEVVESEHANINWIFVLSNPILNETENIKVLRFPWIKKSWGHRLYFDQVIAPKLVKKYKADKVFSLQNITIPRVNCEQIIYVHQSLPFVEYKFTFKNNKLFWIIQNIIGKNIISSIKKAKKVIVQTEWMKQACVQKANVENQKIEVISPAINFKINKYFVPGNESQTTFFFPASGMQYKNHQVIIDACKELKNLIHLKYEIIFTLTGNESQYVEGLYNQIKEDRLPIHFSKAMSRADVFAMYAKSILIFPSYIETFGLPILEARLHKGIILAADTPFAHEILDDYANAYFFNPFDSNELVILIQDILKNKISYRAPLSSKTELSQNRKLIKSVLQ
ncbi:glycosyltransferase [Bacillus sp. SD075]|uniref:glycosyltransferase n=1 Tax=Bacillus sp. SD075 TaxID=2781732 RepID=UPI001A96B4D4|nr:glycosyltransferase [Bacillus sp. SD075]MBO0996442.1 glycosyltransferase [Bacillus sp. SD075]